MAPHNSSKIRQKRKRELVDKKIKQHKKNSSIHMCKIDKSVDR
jgi:hypothetical protein